jgi:hypothetical protein
MEGKMICHFNENRLEVVGLTCEILRGYFTTQ